jgi:hypothetical protein
LFFASLLFSAVLAAGSHRAAAEAAEAPQIASWRVLEAAGSVRYRLPGGATWSRAATGDALPPGTRIVTDDEATLASSVPVKRLPCDRTRV